MLRSGASNHDDYIFELKMDGFRARAYVGRDETRLVSRRGNTFKRLPELVAVIHIDLDREAVLDGKIVVLDSEDLRPRPLVERKRILRSIVPEQPSVLLYAGHIERNGVQFFQLTCQRDLEGIVAKRTDGAYGENWFKIRNPAYSQRENRRAMFEKMR